MGRPITRRLGATASYRGRESADGRVIRPGYSRGQTPLPQECRGGTSRSPGDLNASWTFALAAPASTDLTRKVGDDAARLSAVGVWMLIGVQTDSSNRGRRGGARS